MGLLKLFRQSSQALKIPNVDSSCEPCLAVWPARGPDAASAKKTVGSQAMADP